MTQKDLIARLLREADINDRQSLEQLTRALLRGNYGPENLRDIFDPFAPMRKSLKAFKKAAENIGENPRFRAFAESLANEINE